MYAPEGRRIDRDRGPGRDRLRLLGDLRELAQLHGQRRGSDPHRPHTSRWRLKGPFGRTLEWEAQTTQKEQNSSIAWNSTQGEVGTSGEVRFLEAAKALAAEGGDAVILRLVVPALDGAATMLQPEQDTSGQGRKTTPQETPEFPYISGYSDRTGPARKALT